MLGAVQQSPDVSFIPPRDIDHEDTCRCGWGWRPTVKHGLLYFQFVHYYHYYYFLPAKFYSHWISKPVVCILPLSGFRDLK